MTQHIETPPPTRTTLGFGGVQLPIAIASMKCVWLLAVCVALVCADGRRRGRTSDRFDRENVEKKPTTSSAPDTISDSTPVATGTERTTQPTTSDYPDFEDESDTTFAATPSPSGNYTGYFVFHTCISPRVFHISGPKLLKLWLQIFLIKIKKLPCARIKYKIFVFKRLSIAFF